ncbi:MAG: transcriptional initiation protein Tat [Gammaproteobacteria bacterium]
MSSKADVLHRSRRAFLSVLGMAGGAATVFALGRGMVGNDSPERAETPKPAAQSTGYHLTEHIRTYYDKARF